MKTQKPLNKVLPCLAAVTLTAACGGPPLTYHNGSVVHGTTNIYYTWYGDWSKDTGSNSTQAIFTDLASHIGGSPYLNIVTAYSDGSGPASADVKFGGSTMDSYSQGRTLTDAGMSAVVSAAQNKWNDPNGFYVVVGASDVIQSGSAGKLGTDFCGWHSGNMAFIGTASLTCLALGIGPNFNAAGDWMASTLAHEVAEYLTDPAGGGWYDDHSKNGEIGDKCVNGLVGALFGITYPKNLGSANVQLGNRDYLLQELWLNSADDGHGGCVLHR